LAFLVSLLFVANAISSDVLDQAVRSLSEKAPPAQGEPGNPAPEGRSAAVQSDLPEDQITKGLKEALDKGLRHAIEQLGQEGGFLSNVNVRIPMPAKLKSLEKTLRKIGEEKVADDFINTMNHAAEQAVPAAAEVFTASLKQMTVEDAKGILGGEKDAATQYFRRVTSSDLTTKFRPIVQAATEKTGVTAAYKDLMAKAKFASPFLSKDTMDLDGYVTEQAMNGLFKMVAEEEKRIRDNPIARTTDLLKSVFGGLKP
jgi:hypothetical protein